MKKSIAVVGLLFVCCIATAQTPGQPGNNVNIRICTPSRASMLPPPLVVIFKDEKVVYKTNIGMPNIKPNDIASIQVLKGNSAIEKYGAKATYGVVEIYMKKGAKLDTNEIKPDTNKNKFKTDTGKAIKYRGGK